MVAVLSAMSLIGVIAGCSGSGSDAAPTSTSVEQDGGELEGAAEFPVVLEHTFGETTIAAEPERIVTVGLTDQDPLLALGVVPVGVTEWFGEYPSATWPWAQDELGDASAVVVGDANAIGFEQIAALEPDLILAVYSGLTRQDYDLLEQIAPTIAQPADEVNYGVTWQEQTTVIGRAVGKGELAEQLVADVEQQFDDARAAFPEFEGATGLVVSPAADGSQLNVYAPDEVRGRFLADLGFVQPPEIADIAGDEFSATVSPERADLVDVDALVWIVNDVESDRVRIREAPLIARLDATTQGRDVYVSNFDELGGALSFVTVLSLPYLLDQMVPKLAAAVDGDPTTPT